MRRDYRRISYVRLPQQRSFSDCCLHCRFFRVFDLPRFCGVPEYLSGRCAKHGHYVIFHDFLWRMFEKNEMVFTAANDGDVG
jgi:hypothetical protein